MGMQAIIAFLLYAVVNAFTPGPGNILALNTVTNYGWEKGKKLFLGIFAGYYVVQILCALFVFGLNLLLSPVMSVMKYIGVVYILYLSIHIALSKPLGADNQKSASFLKGFMLQFVNVKIYMFGITALTGYVVPYNSSFAILMLAELVIATIGSIATLTWIFCGSLFEQAYQKYFRAINIFLALILIECAWSMIT